MYVVGASASYNHGLPLAGDACRIKLQGGLCIAIIRLGHQKSAAKSLVKPGLPDRRNGFNSVAA